MNDDERLQAVLAAVTGAMVGQGDDLVVDLEALENGLAAAGINCTSTTNRGALAGELTVVREELRVQRTRLRHAEGDRAQDIQALIVRLDAREREITDLLWPSR